ncbi:MAG: Phosphoenolpyruvate synthase [Candidatus Gottesmanbacteria bacterium GW2011_GWA1_47_8]|uniref:Phosphoenolpyruvate synthase n=1 Tax=Candidatus Gottesmanbacteria bacterium GW2011_GWA1_47_8 TaxID=1618438 RepID=A0A0G1VR78_9BACT|nr:MAG: Phosphoenolpyruvate synthase [Candidatus Gottesmanbacteria bacterium GW2011_GWA1_47_8]
MAAPEYVLPFSKIDKHDVAIVGGKGANLGEMVQAGFPVPDGFCLTAAAYRRVIAENSLEDKIRSLLRGLDVADTRKLESVSAKVRRLISRADIPPELVRQIVTHYHSLKGGIANPLVAVRSSATAEDLPEASFAGQQETYLNVQGEANLIQAIRNAWASLFEARAVFYRQTQGFDHLKVALAIPVQLMVASRVSGVMFSINPVTNNKNVVVIEAIWGLGEKIVQGAYTPDHYEVDKDSLRLRSKVVVPQKLEYVRHKGSNKELAIPISRQKESKLTDRQIVEMAKLAIRLQQHYFFPQDVEWAEENGKLYLVQTRPVTTIKAVGEKTSTIDSSQLTQLKLLLKGDPASPGITGGRVRIIRSVRELHVIQTGDVLVTTMTTPDFVPAMRKAVAIITDRGGQTSHAAIVSRELGVPAIVGTKIGTRILKSGQSVMVNGTSGEIWQGTVAPSERKVSLKPSRIGGQPVKTATKVYVNLGEPELAGGIATRDVDGVGLHDGKQKVFIDRLAEGLAKLCSAFGYRPVVYRTSDFKTNEYRNLVGGQAYEPLEPNPMLGYRGAFRYVTDEQVFELELQAIKAVRNKMGYKNLWLMIPFVRNPRELAKVKNIIAANGLYRSSNFKLWMMVEIPTNVILLEDYVKVGIDGISIGSNDLTMLTLGVDRDNESVAVDYDERDPAALWMFETAIKKAHKLGITSSMCGQAPSEYSDLTRKLIEWGISSVSVSPDVIEKTRDIVAECERRLAR